MEIHKGSFCCLDYKFAPKRSFIVIYGIQPIFPSRLAVKTEKLVTQLCPTPCDPVDCRPPGFSVHGVLQERILEWVAITFSIKTIEHKVKF